MATTATAISAPGARGGGIAQPAERLGHPRGLSVLFMTEMWERFSYYGMRALLVLYMVKFLLLPQHVGTVIGFAGFKAALTFVFGKLSDQETASQIYGLYTALVYLTPIFGGLLADRVLGQRKCVVLGAGLMAAGQFMLASPALFLPALLVLILGNGAFKPNTASQVGELYKPGDARRDRGYSIFYVGINLGAFIAPFICGTLGEDVGWDWGFAAGGVGLLAAILVYLGGRRFLPPDRLATAKARHIEHAPLTRTEWKAVAALILMICFNAFFWAIYEQQGNTIPLWGDAEVDRHIGLFGYGFDFKTTWIQAINPMYIFSLTPFVVAFWAWQAKRGREPSSIAKMAYGCFLAGAAHLVLMAAALLNHGGAKAGLWWLFAYFVPLTLGELYLSPVGLSLVSKAAPIKIASMLMGMWYLANFAGNYLCGWLGTFWDRISHADFFGLMAAIGIAAGLAIWSLKRPLDAIINA